MLIDFRVSSQLVAQRCPGCWGVPKSMNPQDRNLLWIVRLKANQPRRVCIFLRPDHPNKTKPLRPVVREERSWPDREISGQRITAPVNNYLIGGQRVLHDQFDLPFFELQYGGHAVVELVRSKKSCARISYRRLGPNKDWRTDPIAADPT